MCLFAILFFGPRVITVIKLDENRKEHRQIFICKSVSRPEIHLCLLTRKKGILYHLKRMVLRYAFYKDTRKLSKTYCHNISVGYQEAIWQPSNK